MTTGRTHDAKVFIDTGTSAVQLANMLGLTIDGSATTTTEYLLGSEYAEASVHAMGGGVSFSTLYDVPSFDAVAELAESSPQTQSTFVAVCDAAPKSWHAIPVSWPQPGVEAPAADAITRPWSLTRAGGGAAGVLVTPFSVASGATRTLASGVNPSNGTVLALLLSAFGNGITAAKISGPGLNSTNVARRSGYSQYSISGASGTVTLSLTGGSATVAGFVLQGKKEVVPSG